jgi:L-malate glycosyltransferase
MYLVENAHGNDVVIQTKEDDGRNIERSRKILPLADRVIVPSSYFKEMVAKTFVIITRSFSVLLRINSVIIVS